MFAFMNGKRRWKLRFESTLHGPSVQGHMLAGKQTAPGRSIPPLQLLSMPYWINGIMTGIKRLEFSQTTRHYEAENYFGGVVVVVQRARCTAGRPAHTLQPLASRQQDALVVPGTRFVKVTLCKLFMTLLLILTLTRMVSVLLKSQAQPASLSIAGCQMSLAHKSDL